MGVVLVVDEAEYERTLSASILLGAGHQVLSAATEDQALTVLDQRTPIDLLFTEISMWNNVHGGLVLAERAVSLQPKLPVLYTTGRGITVEMRNLFVSRFAFLGKPYGPQDLRKAVANVLTSLRYL
jgi:two-component system, response regulator PdtaR